MWDADPTASHDVLQGLLAAAGPLPPVPLLGSDSDDDAGGSARAPGGGGGGGVGGGGVAASRLLGGGLLLSWNGSCALVWRPHDCARLRALGRLCASPVGLCAARLATRGKAAAVPLVLSDEELAVAAGVAAQAWRTAAVDSRSGAAMPLEALLEASAARAVAAGGARAAAALRLRRLVFGDLWRRGYRCTAGLKFGCDYLAYTADASCVHAAFMVIVRRDGGGGGGDIAALDLVAKSRVATTALKICVMAFGDEGTGRVRYAAFKRMGPGSAIFEAVAAAAAAAAATEAARADGTLVSAASTRAEASAAPAAPLADDASALAFLPEAAVQAMLLDRG